MKKIFIAYVPRSIIKTPDDIIEWIYDDFVDEPVLVFNHSNSAKFFKYKGRKLQWDKEDWPPTKIKITVEILGENNE